MSTKKRLEKSPDIFTPSETRRILKNVIVISIAFMVQFTAYSAAANLQSSINATAGLGTASLAVVCGTLIFSNILLPAAVIKWLGTKWTICVSFVTYMPYIAAQLWPRFYTMIPAALIVGLTGGPLWCAKCTYISVVSKAYSKISNISAEALLVRFLGVFFMIFQTSQVWGNLISSLVLSSGHNDAAVTAVNATMIPLVCGASFLPNDDAEEVLQTQPKERIEMLVGIYLACMAGAAIIVAIGVDSMKRYDYGRPEPATDQSGFHLLTVTLKVLIEPNQLLLLIINVFIGYRQAFFGADFTASFVSCAIGTGTVGFVMMMYGIANSLGCIVTGYLGKVTGRMPLIIFATLVDTALFLTLLLWRPQANMDYVLYSIAVIWGLVDSIWIVQMNAYYGILFPGREEAAFANFRLWESAGYVIAYILSPYLRTSAKVYLLFAMLTVGINCYFVLEFKERKHTRKFEIKSRKEEDSCRGYGKGCDNTVVVQKVE